ncbi:MAG: DUF4331 domain-containing protein, partial [Sphingomonas sp.]|nr:DUF4331 domain-containing protein [Sphingomonas sp.]
REAPNITELRKVDNTDVYAFRSYEPGRDDFITLISNFQPDQEPGGGPNYYTLDPDALYEIMIDNNGDAVEDVTFQFRFANRLKNGTGCTLTVGGKTLSVPVRQVGQVTVDNDPDLCERETYSVRKVDGDRRSGTARQVTSSGGEANVFVKPFDNAGNKTIPNYESYADRFIYRIAIPGCAAGGRMFVGQREEGFAVNLGPIFDLVNFVPLSGETSMDYGGPFPGGITQSEDNQELQGNYNTTSIAIEVPRSCLSGSGNGVIGVWSSASLPQSRMLKTNPTFLEPDTQGGAFVQVSRLGNPLVNEVVIGLKDKDLFNAVKPTADAALADYVTNPTYPAYLDMLFRTPVRAVIGGSGTIAPTNFPRNDLVATFLTGIPTLNQQSSVTPSEMLRLNMVVNPTPRTNQRQLGVIADDLAGFPNGRRPGDDVVDIVLRVAMGRLCHPIPINGKQTQLGFCSPSDAPTGTAPYTDGAPSRASDLFNRFPYLLPALRGAPRPQNQP